MTRTRFICICRSRYRRILGFAQTAADDRPKHVARCVPAIARRRLSQSATIWESSRICAAAVAGQPERSRSRINYVLSELILGIGEVAVAAGLTQIVSVFDARIFRVLKAAGCNPQVIGTPNALAASCVTLASLRPARGRCRRFAPQRDPALSFSPWRQRDGVCLNEPSLHSASGATPHKKTQSEDIDCSAGN